MRRFKRWLGRLLSNPAVQLAIIAIGLVSLLTILGIMVFAPASPKKERAQPQVRIRSAPVREARAQASQQSSEAPPKRRVKVRPPEYGGPLTIAGLVLAVLASIWLIIISVITPSVKPEKKKDEPKKEETKVEEKKDEPPKEPETQIWEKVKPLAVVAMVWTIMFVDYLLANRVGMPWSSTSGGASVMMIGWISGIVASLYTGKPSTPMPSNTSEGSADLGHFGGDI